VARMTEMRSAYRSSVIKREKKRPLGGMQSTWTYKIKIHVNVVE
jgi:hypothetical protein